MRLLLVAALLLFQHSEPSRPTTKPAVEERNGNQQTDGGQNQVGNPAPAISVDECVGCFHEVSPPSADNQKNPYNAKDDTLYRVYLWFTIGGVCVGLGGLGFLYSQVRITATQVDALRKTERAYVLMDGLPKLKDPAAPYPMFIYKLANVGKTPAILVEAHGRLQIGNASLPHPPDPSVYEHSKVEFPLLGTEIIPATGEPREEFGKSKETTQQQRDSVWRTQDSSYWACGFFIYWDVFGREYEERFCYRYFVLDGAVGGFYLAGPKEFNASFVRDTRTYFPKYKTTT